MLFTSIEFLGFFTVFCFLWHVCPRKLRSAVLLIVNLGFYALFSVEYLPVLAGVILVSYGMALVLEKAQKRRKLLLALGIVLLLAPMCVFKYTNFALGTISAVAARFGRSFGASVDWVAPVGLSFYSLQAVGYLIDIYRGEKAEHNLLRYGAFAGYFPVLASGPIERRDNLLRQLGERQPFCPDKIRRGIVYMAWGYFLKMVIADRAGLLVDTVFAGASGYGSTELIFAAVLYAVQLYCDFASYSFLAYGCGLCMGLELICNFNAPYFAASAGEFWRRWHISLSGWFRDYLYIPLGGNRKGPWRKRLNAFLVMLVSGLWHGAGWHYVAWGALHGLYQAGGDALKPLRRKICAVCHTDPQKGGNRFFRIVFNFILMDFAWIFFRADSMTKALEYVRRIVTQWNPWVLFNGTLFSLGLDQTQLGLLLAAVAVLFCVDLALYRKVDVAGRLLDQGIVFRWIVYLAAILSILIFGLWGSGYDASSFIYFQF